MAQFDFTEEEITAVYSRPVAGENISADPEHINAITGGDDTSRYLYFQLKQSFARADRIDLMVSFLMESGVRIICGELKKAMNRGAGIRILTGNYLGITQPSALYLIKQELGDYVDLRFYSDPERSFHPKAYMFRYGQEGDIFIGSSNLSRSALTSGIEWNYRLSRNRDPEAFQSYLDTFEDLFDHHSIILDDEELHRYSRNWHSPAIAKEIIRLENDSEKNTDKILPLYQPRGAQIEALYALNASREEGAVKALVHAATGIGKTYLAAFDSAGYNRVLFVAHREEILNQAAAAFRNVRRSDDFGFFRGQEKDTDRSVIFASVETLGRPKYLCPDYFEKDYFDYIVIDEFHHAVNKQYRRIVDYFRPKFLLGLTATPDRLDGRNIYEICDYNVPFELPLKDAINQGMLAPFHYYGIYDDTDYTGLRVVNGKYDDQELTEIYRQNGRRYDLIYRNYLKHRSRRALGFCCSRMHAEEMAREFCSRGIPSVAVYSNATGQYSEDREQAVRDLKNGEIRVIFCVDMFNEGLDIESLDMVMFLRPTESPVVFLQQLGRGLRLYPGKEYLNVLDFIGNYEKAGMFHHLLADEKDAAGRETGGSEFSGDEVYPDDCVVDFDLRLVDLFRTMEKNALPARKRISQEYVRIKNQLDGKVPSRMELFTYMDEEVYEYCLRNPRKNPFRSYLSFLREQGDLSEEEQELYSGIGREFLSVIETTAMTKVYKMPILYSFYNDGDFRMEVTDAEVLEAWKKFFDTGTNWKDFSDGITYREFQDMTDQQHLNKAKTMPIRFLLESGQGFFIVKKGYALALRPELAAVSENPAFLHHMKDVLEYRTMNYYRRRYRDSG